LSALFLWSDDPAQTRLNEPYRPLNWAQQEAFWLNATADQTRIFFAIRIRTGPDIIGYVQIRDIAAIHRSANIGILIGKKDVRRNGYGREAMHLAIEYCWSQLNLTRLALHVFADNRPAITLYRRLGFRQEGLHERALFIDGQWVDLVAMALTHPDRLRAEG
jgi:RimJ/RimL family protein N-acetyltransferase